MPEIPDDLLRGTSLDARGKAAARQAGPEPVARPDEPAPHGSHRPAKPRGGLLVGEPFQGKTTWVWNGTTWVNRDTPRRAPAANWDFNPRFDNWFND